MTSTKRYKLRRSAVFALALLIFSVAAVGVSAYEPCQRFVQKYVEKVVPAVHHHYSKETVAKWVEWGKDHPNWHPVKRRPRLETKETLDKVNFDCNVPEQNDQITGLLDPDPLPELPLMPQLVAINTAPPVIARPVSLVTVPVDSPVINAIETPESSSWILGLTGALFLVACERTRRVRLALRLDRVLPAPAPAL